MNAACFRPRAAGAQLAPTIPSRARIQWLAMLLVGLLAALALRAVQIAVAGGPAPAQTRPAAAVTSRADIVDRNGVLLVTTLPSYILTARPAEVWDAPDVARRLAAALPDLDRAATERRLLQSDRQLVYLRRGLNARQRAEIFALGLPGVGFERDRARVYPHGTLAAHVLGHVDHRFMGVAGVERSLEQSIVREGGVAGAPVRLSLDVRIQHALERELADGAARAQARGAAGIVLDARTGEVLALASVPAYDPNDPPAVDAESRRSRAAATVYEMGSTLKPFTFIAAIEAGLVRQGETWRTDAGLRIPGLLVEDLKPQAAPLTLAQALARSSNVVSADLALRLGSERLRAAFQAAGLFDRAPIEAPDSEVPLAPSGRTRVDTAVLGYGHGAATTLASLASAYTVFSNDGARVRPTLLARDPAVPAEKIQVFDPAATRAVLAMMRAAAVEGTARLADVPGLDVAAKTGTAEKPGEGGYDPDRMLSSIAAVFPAHDPRYVVVVALDEPQRTAETGGSATGGATAAPTLARFLARAAPMLGVQPISPQQAALDEGVRP